MEIRDRRESIGKESNLWVSGLKILFVHEVDYLEKVVFEMHEIPELLADRGHQITFVDFPEHEKLWPPRIRSRTEHISGRVVPSSQLTLVRLARVFPFPFDRIWSAATSGIKIRQLLRTARPDLIFLYGVPTNGWQTTRLAQRLKIPIIYRAIDVSHEIRRSIFWRAVKVAEKYVVRNVDLVLTNNTAMSKHMISLGATEEKIRVLFPGVAGVEEKKILAHGEKRHDVILFMGTLFDFCGLANLITWIEQWKGTARDCELWILGDGPSKRDIIKQAAKCDYSDKLKLFGFVPFDHLYEIMKIATVAVLPFEEIPVTHKALPGKVPQYITAGLPVVSTRLNGLRSLLAHGNGALYAAPGKEFVDQINKLLDNDEMRRNVVELGQNQLNRVCRWPNVIAEIEMIISQMAGKNYN